MRISLLGHHDDTVVLDPFVGIGNSAVADQTCRVGRFIGFDIDDQYFAEAAERTGSAVRPRPPFSTPNRKTN